MLARLLQAGVWVNPSQRCTRIFRSVCQKNACSLSLSSSIFAGSNPAVCNYSISPVDWFVLRDAKDDVHELVCERTFSVQVFVIIQQSEKCFGTSCRAMQSEPCLRMDTVLSQIVPKDLFPHCAGGTQIFSRCFCMNDSEATLLPLRRITYYEKDDY